MAQGASAHPTVDGARHARRSGPSEIAGRSPSRNIAHQFLRILRALRDSGHATASSSGKVARATKLTRFAPGPSSDPRSRWSFMRSNICSMRRSESSAACVGAFVFLRLLLNRPCPADDEFSLLSRCLIPVRRSRASL